jgi:hypothetical protein
MALLVLQFDNYMLMVMGQFKSSGEKTRKLPREKIDFFKNNFVKLQSKSGVQNPLK